MQPQAVQSPILTDLRDALEAVYGDDLRGVYLYGSHARHTAQPESDMDVLVVLRDFTDYWQEIKRTGHIVAALSLKYGVSISLVRVRESEWQHEDSPFLNAVRRECVAA
ncbi:MAG: nucleotidyltransferase domain-containing protein [Verrucomicrobiae bacterium]|nr:nucleotidyltransferase domain-containing protein [Verrucomicrobiae bacterium]